MSLCGKTQRQIETWFRLRRNQDRPCRTTKFGVAAYVLPLYSFQCSGYRWPLWKEPLSQVNLYWFICRLVYILKHSDVVFLSRSWRFFFYFIAFTAGLASLIDVSFQKEQHLDKTIINVFKYVVHFYWCSFILQFSFLYRNPGFGTPTNVGGNIQFRWKHPFTICFLTSLDN